MLYPTGVGEMQQLKDDGLNHISAAFLPDGKRFVFSGTEAGHGVRLYLESLDEGKAHPFSMEGVGSGILLSWDGQFVATHGPDQKTYLFPIAGGEPSLFLEFSQVKLRQLGQATENLYSFFCADRFRRRSTRSTSQPVIEPSGR